MNFCRRCGEFLVPAGVGERWRHEVGRIVDHHAEPYVSGDTLDLIGTIVLVLVLAASVIGNTIVLFVLHIVGIVGTYIFTRLAAPRAKLSAFQLWFAWPAVYGLFLVLMIRRRKLHLS